MRLLAALDRRNRVAREALESVWLVRLVRWINRLSLARGELELISLSMITRTLFAEMGGLVVQGAFDCRNHGLLFGPGTYCTARSRPVQPVQRVVSLGNTIGDSPF